MDQYFDSWIVEQYVDCFYLEDYVENDTPFCYNDQKIGINEVDCMLPVLEHICHRESLDIY